MRCGECEKREECVRVLAPVLSSNIRQPRQRDLWLFACAS
jgi:hypothetical protein